jgi:kynurenine formamidase
MRRQIVMLLIVCGAGACGAPPSAGPPRDTGRSASGASSAVADPLVTMLDATPDGAGHLVDLTHTFDARTIVWPTSRPFEIETVHDGMTADGYYYAANDLATAEHGGTHLDAPIHFAEGRQTAEEVPLWRLLGRAVVVDVSVQAEEDRDYLITVRDLQRWEDEHGRLEPRRIVLLRTGYSTRWPDAERYLGTAARGAEGVAQLHFPGLHPDAATWLVRDREVAAVGIDTASIDRGQSTLFEAHRVLAASDVPVFENLARLDALPARGAVVIALPMKVGGGSGAPLRAVALVP